MTVTLSSNDSETHVGMPLYMNIKEASVYRRGGHVPVKCNVIADIQDFNGEYVFAGISMSNTTQTNGNGTKQITLCTSGVMSVHCSYEAMCKFELYDIVCVDGKNNKQAYNGVSRTLTCLDWCKYIKQSVQRTNDETEVVKIMPAAVLQLGVQVISEIDESIDLKQKDISQIESQLISIFNDCITYHEPEYVEFRLETHNLKQIHNNNYKDEDQHSLFKLSVINAYSLYCSKKTKKRNKNKYLSCDHTVLIPLKVYKVYSYDTVTITNHPAGYLIYNSEEDRTIEFTDDIQLISEDGDPIEYNMAIREPSFQKLTFKANEKIYVHISVPSVPPETPEDETSLEDEESNQYPVGIVVRKYPSHGAIRILFGEYGTFSKSIPKTQNDTLYTFPHTSRSKEQSLFRSIMLKTVSGKQLQHAQYAPVFRETNTGKCITSYNHEHDLENKGTLEFVGILMSAEQPSAIVLGTTPVLANPELFKNKLPNTYVSWIYAPGPRLTNVPDKYRPFAIVPTTIENENHIIGRFCSLCLDTSTGGINIELCKK